MTTMQHQARQPAAEQFTLRTEQYTMSTALNTEQCTLSTASRIKLHQSEGGWSVAECMTSIPGLGVRREPVFTRSMAPRRWGMS